MNQRSLRKLEYYKILAKAAEKAVSELGKEKVLMLLPQTNPKRVREQLERLDEVCRFRQNTGINPINYFRDVKKYIAKTDIGGVLQPLELLAVLEVCLAAVNVKNTVIEAKIIDSLPFLLETAQNLFICHNVIDYIRMAITPEGEVADSASSQLREIRRNLRLQSQRVRDSLDKIIRSSVNQKYLQEAVITERNGRFVIPVKSEFRGMIPGIIHDQSQTGSTVFIEPSVVVEAENEIRRLEADEKHEVDRILGDLSRLVHNNGQDIQDNEDTLVMLDVLFAKAAYAMENDCTMPEITDKLSIRIVKGRHPLIPRERCVPIDVEIGYNFRTLIVTGPNTGGKTVSLKTVGLFILLAQTGFFVPAARVQMGIFEDILCDIGDEQAIEQNLSTFSSHMTNIIYILNNVKPNSLILFDELCTGTDPVEGSALARSILSDLNSREVLTFSTTHYSELKTFAFETEGMENASMEFDIDTLMPTYKLVVGIPGKSNALEISRKLGLNEKIILDAQTNIDKDELNVNRLISDMEHNRVIAEKEKQDADAILRMAEETKRQYDEKMAQVAVRRQEEMNKANEQASRIIAEAEEEAREIIKELRYNVGGTDGKEKNEQIEAARKRLSDKKKQYETENKKKRLSGLTASDLHPGMTVFVNHLGTTGNVLEIVGNDEVLLQVGILKTKARINTLELTENEEKQPVKTEHKKIDLKTSITTTLDLRGKTAEDAYIEIDRFIDSSLMTGLEEVTILHGKGTGALRTAVHEYLRKHKHVGKFRIGKYGEGDTGVTIVTLK